MSKPNSNWTPRQPAQPWTPPQTPSTPPLPPRPGEPAGWDTPQPAPAGNHGNDGAKPKLNTCAVVGFIFSFLMWIVGLIVSIIALVQINKRHERGKGLAIAGIVISVIMAVVSVTAGVAMTKTVIDEANRQQANATAAAPKKQSTKQLDKDIEKGLDDVEKDENPDSNLDDLKLFGSMDEFANSSLLQNEMKTAIGDSFDGTGANITYRAEDDVLVMDIALPDQYASAGPQLAQQLDTLDDSGMQEFADSLPDAVTTTSTPGVRMFVHAGATSIWDHTWMAQ